MVRHFPAETLRRFNFLTIRVLSNGEPLADLCRRPSRHFWRRPSLVTDRTPTAQTP
jgi:hypothetical protein